MPDPLSCQPYRESLWATLRRTLAIAVLITTLLTILLPHEGGHVGFWLAAYPAVLWFPLGGHYVELVYLNVLRIRWEWCHRHHAAARIMVWLIGGLPLGLGCWWTWALTGSRPAFDLPFWWGMPFFVVVECIVHAVLTLFGKPSFWNRRE